VSSYQPKYPIIAGFLPLQVMVGCDFAGDVEDEGSITGRINISMSLDTESIEIDPNPQARHKQNLYDYFFGHLGKM
jgi:hypothetical protein